MTKRWSKLPLVLGAFVLFAAGNAAAEDTHAGYGNPAVTYQNQQQKPVYNHGGGYDQQYTLPKSYNGKYYPDDDTIIGYHGTHSTAQNSTTNQTSQTPYYYYY